MRNARAPIPIYFAGNVGEPVWKPTEERVRDEQRFLHYVCTIWVNENAVPTDAAALAKFDIRSLWPEYRSFIQGGGRIPERGLSIDEFWLGLQLSVRSPVTCFLNAAQPQQEVRPNHSTASAVRG